MYSDTSSSEISPISPIAQHVLSQTNLDGNVPCLNSLHSSTSLSVL